MSQKLYELDFYAWTLQQAELLRSQTQQDLDWANLAEELEDMGKNLKRELESRLKVLFAHLLKWQYQPSHRGHSWQYTIEEQRNELADHLADNPSLRSKLPEAIERGYRNAIVVATRETGLSKSSFPHRVPLECRASSGLSVFTRVRNNPMFLHNSVEISRLGINDLRSCVNLSIVRTCKG